MRSSTKDAKYQLMQERQKSSTLEKTINDVCAEFPNCNIPTDEKLPQKVHIVSKAKDLEDTIENMDVE